MTKLTGRNQTGDIAVTRYGMYVWFDRSDAISQYFNIQLNELTVYFKQTAAGVCWNSGKTNQSFGEFYSVYVEFE